MVRIWMVNGKWKRFKVLHWSVGNYETESRLQTSSAFDDILLIWTDQISFNEIILGCDVCVHGKKVLGWKGFVCVYLQQSQKKYGQVEKKNILIVISIME